RAPTLYPGRFRFRRSSARRLPDPGERARALPRGQDRRRCHQRIAQQGTDMTGTLGLLETTGLTPAMVAIDAMTKMADVHVVQLELNDLYGVCVKISGQTADVQRAIEEGRRVADEMQGSPVATVLTRVSVSGTAALESPPEYNPLIEQNVVFAMDQ